MKQVVPPERQLIEKNHWNCYHHTAGYSKMMRVVDDNVVHSWVEPAASGGKVDLDVMDVPLFLTVLTEAGLNDRSFHVLLDLQHVHSISFAYKKAIADMFFNWTPQLGVVCFLNVEPSMKLTLDMFNAVAPQRITVVQCGDYEAGMEVIGRWKEHGGKLVLRPVPESREEQLEDLFYVAIARISWLNLLEVPVAPPGALSAVANYFSALESLRSDLLARENEREQELRLLQNRCDERKREQTVRCNAQLDTARHEVARLAEENLRLKQRLALVESELNQRAGLVGNLRNSLAEMVRQVHDLDLAPRMKEQLTVSPLRLLEPEVEFVKTEQVRSDSDLLFVHRMQREFPSLNSRELEVCLMVRHNFCTSRMADSIGVSKRGMESIRYRIHKKLGLARHQSIKTFLSERDLW